VQRSTPGDSSHLTRRGRGEHHCRQHHQLPLGRQRGHLNRPCSQCQYDQVPLRKSCPSEINYISFELLGDHEVVHDFVEMFHFHAKYMTELLSFIILLISRSIQIFSYEKENRLNTLHINLQSLEHYPNDSSDGLLALLHSLLESRI
jgi:hypothetical protein